MAVASGVTIELVAGALPIYEGVIGIAAANRSGGMESNREHFASLARCGGRRSGADSTSSFDPQTSGGLLVALAPDAVPRAIAALEAAGDLAAVDRRSPRARGGGGSHPLRCCDRSPGRRLPLAWGPRARRPQTLRPSGPDPVLWPLRRPYGINFVSPRRVGRPFGGVFVIPDLSVFWVILSVLVLATILNQLLFKPLTRVIAEREAAVAAARRAVRRSGGESPCGVGRIRPAHAGCARGDVPAAGERAEVGPRPSGAASGSDTTRRRNSDCRGERTPP